MNTLEQRIRSFEVKTAEAREYADNFAESEREDAYYAYLDSSYFTQKFVNLAPQRKIEELSTQLLTILNDAGALTDANIDIVDRIVALRGEVA